MKNIWTYVKQWFLFNWLAIVVGILLGFAAGAVLAADATASWTHPTQNTDGSVLPLSGIASTRVEWGTCAGSAFGTKQGEVVVPAPATSTTITGLAAGSTICARAYTRSTAGVESAPSNVSQKSLPFPTPNPPTLAAIATVAYDVKWSWKDGAFVLNKQVGTVAIGTPCNADFTLPSGYARVEREDVKLKRGTSSPVLVARCA